MRIPVFPCWISALVAEESFVVEATLTLVSTKRKYVWIGLSHPLLQHSTYSKEFFFFFWRRGGGGGCKMGCSSVPEPGVITTL